MKIVFGLGNPGRQYDGTYHNLGFVCIDRLASRLGVQLNRGKFNSIFGQTKVGDEIVLLAKPLTFMNLSGDAVKAFVDYFGLSPQDVIVCCDDIDLPKGTFRFREHGSGGTHNGLKNIVFRLQSEDFKRIKIGTSQGEDEIDLKDYVLSKIDEESWTKISPAIDDAVEKILGILDE
jgi:PTH1 family peptidyl-tRNA hydrolase